jgi:hypothetical protein
MKGLIIQNFTLKPITGFVGSWERCPNDTQEMMFFMFISKEI